jgi:hypothetical protein
MESFVLSDAVSAVNVTGGTSMNWLRSFPMSNGVLVPTRKMMAVSCLGEKDQKGAMNISATRQKLSCILTP